MPLNKYSTFGINHTDYLILITGLSLTSGICSLGHTIKKKKLIPPVIMLPAILNKAGHVKLKFLKTGEPSGRESDHDGRIIGVDSSYEEQFAEEKPEVLARSPSKSDTDTEDERDEDEFLDSTDESSSDKEKVEVKTTAKKEDPVSLEQRATQIWNKQQRDK